LAPVREEEARILRGLPRPGYYTKVSVDDVRFWPAVVGFGSRCRSAHAIAWRSHQRRATCFNCVRAASVATWICLRIRPRHESVRSSARSARRAPMACCMAGAQTVAASWSRARGARLKSCSPIRPRVNESSSLRAAHRS